MRTKPAKFESKLAEQPISESVKPANPSEPSPIEEKVNRVSIPLTKDGQIEWDSMREKTRNKVKELMGDGATKVTAAPTVEVFDPAWTGTLYDTIGRIEGFAAIKMYGLDPQIAGQCFSFNQEEKDKLAGPTAKVINKYAPVWLEQFKDEIALAMLFVMMTAAKFQMASMLMAQKQTLATSRRTEPSPTVDVEIKDTVVDVNKN